MKPLAFYAIASAFLSLIAAASVAQAADHNTHSPKAGKAAQNALPMVDGEVRKVDSGGKKITIRHGAIPHLEMQPMTMTFQCRDPELLAQVKAGDKIRFHAQKIDGAYVVTQIEHSK